MAKHFEDYVKKYPGDIALPYLMLLVAESFGAWNMTDEEESYKERAVQLAKKMGVPLEITPPKPKQSTKAVRKTPYKFWNEAVKGMSGSSASSFNYRWCSYDLEKNKIEDGKAYMAQKRKEWEPLMGPAELIEQSNSRAVFKVWPKGHGAINFEDERALKFILSSRQLSWCIADMEIVEQ